MLEELYTHYIMKKIDIDIDLSQLYLEELPGFLLGLHVNGNFYCDGNRLRSLQGAPVSVRGDFYCYDNKVKFTEEQVRAVCNVRGCIYV
jgi:hypothetical protein